MFQLVFADAGDIEHFPIVPGAERSHFHQARVTEDHKGRHPQFYGYLLS